MEATVKRVSKRKPKVTKQPQSELAGCHFAVLSLKDKKMKIYSWLADDEIWVELRGLGPSASAERRRVPRCAVGGTVHRARKSETGWEVQFGDVWSRFTEAS